MINHERMATKVARRLCAARIKAGMRVREVAASLDITHTLILKYENGTVAPSLIPLASEPRQVLQNPIDPAHHQFLVCHPTPHRRRCQAVVIA